MRLTALVLAAALAVPAQAADLPSLFDQPEAQTVLSRTLAYIRLGNSEAARQTAEAGVAQFPSFGAPYVALALSVAKDDPAMALTHLLEAVRKGYRGMAQVLTLPAFAGVRETVEYAALSEAMAKQSPASETKPALVDIERLTAPVSAANTTWDAAEGEFRAQFAVPPVLARRPAIGSAPGLERIAPFINRWVAGGRAAGLAGVLYDNRDRGHSPLDKKAFPQLLHVAYSDPIRSRNLDYGPNRMFEFGRITLGNSSTAITQGPFWRSQARRLLTEPGGARRLFRQYSRNMLYVYPETFDHSDRGADLFPANTPYTIASRGRSHSDRPILRALLLALAAMPPDVRNRAEEEGLVAPLLQRLLRRSLKGIQNETDYLSTAAHPTIFSGDAIAVEDLIRRAQALTLADLAPMVRLTLLTRAPLSPAEKTGMAKPEVVFETPSAIALAFRSTTQKRRLLLSARSTRDPFDRPLTFHWRVLRGDADRITITPESEDASLVAVEIPWHDPFPVPGAPELLSHRVDIGVFADTGESLSAPAFVSMSFPPDQRRSYDAAGRLLEVDHQAAPAYADPWIWPQRDWRDVYAYDPEGQLTGWERHRKGIPAHRFDAKGRLLGPDGPVAVRYSLGAPARDGRRPVIMDIAE